MDHEEKMINVALKGSSMRVQIPDGFGEAVSMMEAARSEVQASAAQESLARQNSLKQDSNPALLKPLEALSVGDFEHEATSMLKVISQTIFHICHASFF